MNSYRKRLLTSTVTTILGGAALIAPQAASAACTVTAGVVTCATTTTTDTNNAGGSPAVDRSYFVDTSAAVFTGTVSTGAVVDGFGLAFSNTLGGTNALNVVNNGAVQINTVAAAAGGTAALDISALGATPINYSGTGTITNLSTTGSALSIDSTGTGNLTATIGGNVSNASVSSFAVAVSQGGTAGNVAVTTATGTTIRSPSGGISGIVNNAASAGTVSITNNAAIASPVATPNTLQVGIAGSSTGTGAVSIVNNGAIGATGDRATSMGINGSITNGASAAALSISGTGAIFSSNVGINAQNSGTGTTTVNYTGAVNTTGGNGVVVTATTGASTVTTGAVTAASTAVTVNSTGPQTIALNGVTTGTTGSGLVSNTSGTRTITVGAAGNVAGGTQAILLSGTGGGSITNGGIIGGAVTGVAINSSSVTGALAITNNATRTINGRLTLGSGADTVVNLGTFNTQGTNDFGAGADSFANNGTGILNLTANTTLVGLEAFSNSGRINLNTFTLTGPAIAFNNTGTIDTSGSATLGGFTSFSNAGTLDLAPGTLTVPVAAFTNTGTILADEGASTITGQTSFANSGTINLQDGVTGDVLTINSGFVGSGGSNLLVDFTGADSDRLVINGAASGTTTVGAAYLGGGFNLDGVLVVDAVTATAGAFVLGTVTGETPLLDVSLVQAGGDFFLVAAPTAATFNPLVVPGFAADLWHQSANEVFAETVKPATTIGTSVWGNGYYSRDKYGDDDDSVVVDGNEFDVDNEQKTRRYGFQAGVDFGFVGGRVGLTGGYAWADSNGDSDADLKAHGWNLGIAGQFGGLTGFHGEFLAKHDRYQAEFDDGAFEGEEVDFRSNGIDGSLGYRFGMGGATLDLHGGLSHVRTKIDDINAFGFDYDIGTITSTRGRAGLRAIFGGGLSPYVDATVYREFDGDGDIEFFDGANTFDVGTNGKGTWVRIEAGLSGNDGPGPILAAWGDFGDRKALGLRAGWRIGGRVAEALPPPPPPAPMAPPPPPPPATQTCADGSVILATDMCPPPPPPPPPAPEPERG